MSLNERDMSLLQAVGDAVKEQLIEREAMYKKELKQRDARIEKLEGDVAGLISLLGEN